MAKASRTPKRKATNSRCRTKLAKPGASISPGIPPTHNTNAQENNQNLDRIEERGTESDVNIINCSNVQSMTMNKRTRFIPPSPLVPMGTLHGGTNARGFGSAVSLSDNGDLIAVGTSHENVSGLYLVQVFQRQSRTSWKQAGVDMIIETERDCAHWTMSLSGNGQWLAFASKHEEKRCVRIFPRDFGETKLFGDNEGDNFGRGGVSFSQNGSRIAIAALNYIRVYEFQSEWIQLGKDISVKANTSVALSGNGKIVAVGVHKSAVKVYECRANEWVQIGGSIEEVSYVAAIDINWSGERIIIGQLDCAAVYEYDSDWKLVGSKMSGVTEECYGSSVSISGDGNRIIVGCCNYCSEDMEHRGRAVVHQYENQQWKKIGRDIIGQNEYDDAGWSVSMSKSGDYVAVGTPCLDKETGYVTIHKIE